MDRKFIFIAFMTICLLGAGSCRSADKDSERLHMGFAELCEALLEKQNSSGQVSSVAKDAKEPYSEDVIHSGTESGGYREISLVDSDEEFSFELRGATLANAFDLIAETAGVNFLLNGNFSETVDVSLIKVTINQALSVLCSAHDCDVVESGGVFIVSRDDANELLTRIFRLHSVSAASLEEHVDEMVGEQGRVIVNKESDIITVTSSRHTLDDVEAYLRSIDRTEKQVLIEAKVIEFSLTDLYELGSELDLGNIHMDESTATVLSSLLTTSRDVTFDITGDKANINGAFNILSKLTTVNVISHPNVMAKNNELATIDIIKEIPYVEATVTTTSDAAEGAGTSSVQTVEFKEVGIKLQVTPSIMSDGTVSLSIDQDVIEHVDTYNGVPVVNHRHIVTKFVVDDRKAILIGGLLKEAYKDEVKGIPLLMDIPLIGFLFRGTTRVKEKVELVVMITPTIVDPRGGGGVPAQYRFPKIAAEDAGEGRAMTEDTILTMFPVGVDEPSSLPTTDADEKEGLIPEVNG